MRPRPSDVRLPLVNRPPPPSRPGLWRGMLAAPLMVLATFYGLCALALVLYTWTFPPTTTVQLQRRIEALSEEAPYAVRYRPVPMEQIAAHLPHAVVAAEDGRFFAHGGRRLGGHRGGPRRPPRGRTSPRRLDDHAAARQEPLPHHAQCVLAEGARAAAGVPRRRGPLEGADPGAVPQRRRVGPGRLRRRGRRAALLRRPRRRAQPLPGRRPRRLPPRPARPHPAGHGRLHRHHPHPHAPDGLVGGLTIVDFRVSIILLVSAEPAT